MVKLFILSILSCGLGVLAGASVWLQQHGRTHEASIAAAGIALALLVVAIVGCSGRCRFAPSGSLRSDELDTIRRAMQRACRKVRTNGSAMVVLAAATSFCASVPFLRSLDTLRLLDVQVPVAGIAWIVAACFGCMALTCGYACTAYERALGNLSVDEAHEIEALKIRQAYAYVPVATQAAIDANAARLQEATTETYGRPIRPLDRNAWLDA